MFGSLIVVASLVAAPQTETVPAMAADAKPVEVAPAARRLSINSAYQTIAMMPLSSLGSTEDVVEAIQRVLTNEMQALLEERLIPPLQLLDKAKLADDAFIQCDGVVICLVEVFGGLGWDAFVVGNIAGLGDSRVINIKLYDVRTGAEVRRASELASGSEAALISNMRAAAVTLLAPELLVGIVELTVGQPGVSILVDGQLAGTTPLKNNRVEVPVGKHAIEASGPGMVPFSKVIDLSYGEVMPIEIVLPTNSAFVGGRTPFRARWWTWVLGSTGILAGGLGGLFYGLHVDAVANIEREARQGTLTSANYMGLYSSADDNYLLTLVFSSIGGALVAATGVLLGLDLIMSDDISPTDPPAPQAEPNAPPAALLMPVP